MRLSGCEANRHRCHPDHGFRLEAGPAEVADAGITVGLRELCTVGFQDQRMMGKPRWRGTVQQVAQADLRRGRVGEVPAADDEIDVLAEVVHDHGEAIRPVALTVADCEVSRDRGWSLPATFEQVVPALDPVAQSHPERQAAVVRERSCTATAGTTRT